MSEPHQPSSQTSQEEQHVYQAYMAATSDLRRKLILKKRHLKVQYGLSSFVFNLLTMVQVIIGAVITALGPSAADHMVAITVLGAINTSCAGLLALLKGRGLPQRLRGSMIEISKFLNFIQETSVLLKYDKSRVPENGIGPLLEESFQRYASAEQLIEGNQPDTFASGIKPPVDTNATDAEDDQGQGPATYKANRKGPQMDEEMGVLGGSGGS
ncbi:hypothetical protein N7532_000023 [Penicillium argentinense]|uniref:SMODS and SLOG-associating 2TM effector domain-containing protein n=1 Tax=Penicillium argentinense TaxID=1131581 RepID=A0A9W9G4U1_9EURO|nr:uncharacterized protein N7532_000023 [Penicillium argentinense]KAJ5111978.1 hypothetical protein N7532_000023 [Penicillium argentinense]